MKKKPFKSRRAEAKPSFLFVSWTGSARPYVDPSTRYRCFNLCQELVRRGHRSQVVSQALFHDNLGSYDNYDKYIFHRPLLTDGMANFLIKQSSTRRIIADFDDLIFDVRSADLTPMVRIRGGNSASIRHYVAGTAEATKFFLLASVSTTPLKKRINDIFPQIDAIIVNNAIDPGYSGLCRLARKATSNTLRPYEYGYFSGTATHDADFAMIAGPLADALSVRPFARLLVVGPVPIPAPLAPYRERIDTMPILKFHDLPFIKSQCNSVIAPLESTLFNECKSGIKFFEAAILGCKVIATPIHDIARFSSPS